jgi:hypothetical protein
MGEFVSKHIENNRTGQTEKRNEPEHCAQREEPEFFACPKPLGHGRARKDSEKCLAENSADRQQKERENKLHPSRRDHEWIRCRNPESIRGPRDISDDLPVALGIAPSAVGCRFSLRCCQSCRRLRRLTHANARPNREFPPVNLLGCRPGWKKRSNSINSPHFDVPYPTLFVSDPVYTYRLLNTGIFVEVMS